MKEPFASAVPILEKLEEAGFEAYFVGGSVRDFLLNRPISDVDIATSATPQEVKTVFTNTVDVGIEHGTVLVLFQNQSYEITTFRAESEYEDFRRPKEVSFIRNLIADLERRDFTMNAMAMNKNGNIIDPFNGHTAIRSKEIKTVGVAADRFQEDALRMMRAVRFVSQLEFQIEVNTLQALKELVYLLDKIAIERKTAEFTKLLTGNNRREALRLTMETNIYSFLPGLAQHKSALEDMLQFDLNKLSDFELWALLAYCLKLERMNIEKFFRDWRLPLKEIRDIQRILLFLDKRLLGEWTAVDLFEAGRECIRSVEKLYVAVNKLENTECLHHYLKVYDMLPIKERREIAVSGNDLINWFERSAGPWVKQSLLKIEAAILEGKVVNQKEAIKEWLLRCNLN